MSSSRNSARQTLAELFDALQPQKAHWYSIISPRSEDPSGERIKVLFPPIATLLSMREDIFEFVLMKCGLMRNIKNKSSPSMNSWENFRSEFQLHIEFTIFSISGKRYNSSESDHGALRILQQHQRRYGLLGIIQCQSYGLQPFR